MKFVLAFDSFKNCLRAQEVCRLMAAGIREISPEAEIITLPLADGGEGTVEAVCAIAGKTPVMIPVTGPLGEPVNAPVMIDGDFAVMEVASACGIELIPKDRLDPRKTTTYGVGELLKALAQRGVRRCVVGLGGSATVDGGTGMLRALGMKFYDAAGRETTGLNGIVRTGALPVPDMDILLASDVDNPLTGSSGAALVFGPQKGATPEMAAELDRAMQHYRTLFNTDEQPGDGAAGGLGFAFRLLGAKRRSGAGWLLEFADFDRKIQNADLVVTGEGRSDGQTACGKLPWIVAEHASRTGVPAALVAGALGPGYEALYDKFVSVSSLAVGPSALEDCLRNAPQGLRRTGRNLAGLLNCGCRS